MSTTHHRFSRSGGVFSGWRWRKLTKRELTISAAAAAVLGVLFLVFSPTSVSREIRSSGTDSDWVSFTPISKSRETSAVCLDGSVPGYHMRRGSGSGSSSWILHVEVQFSGILSSDPFQNPDFFNWNKVKIRYCDGASFSSNPQSEVNNGTKLFFRGQLIWDALMKELLSIGISNANQVLLTGCSAGGLATLIHCDDFRKLLPKDTVVKCLADAGFFPNEKDITGNRTIQSFYRDVEHLQGVIKSLNHDCVVSHSEPYKCFFPQEFIKNVKTPIFLVQPAYDFWQIANVLVPDVVDPHGHWLKCKLNIFNCDPHQIEVIHAYRNSLLRILDEIQQNAELGMFVNSCFVHCQTWMTETWHSTRSPRINNRTIAESVGDWFFKKDAVKHIDCPFPCNPTCYNMDLTHW